ncbi:Uncharacterised protein [uncultured Ruminococcus sp.]|nr:Uncharacterised protein [uncultured Ruminococcus sp.]
MYYNIVLLTKTQTMGRYPPPPVILLFSGGSNDRRPTIIYKKFPK